MWVGKKEDLKDCAQLPDEAKTKILAFLRDNDMVALSAGRHDISEDVYVNIFEYETKQNVDNVFEIHKEYADIHYAITNGEKVLLGDKFDSITKPYQADGDYSLGIIANPKEIELKDVVCVCLPEEPHKAGIVLESAKIVKKAVFKIKMA